MRIYSQQPRPEDGVSPAKKMNVAILGASIKPERYAYKAQKMLMERDYMVYPISPVYQEVLAIKTYASITELSTSIDTLTLYLHSDKLIPYLSSIIDLHPRRVIFNPGTENIELQQTLLQENIEVLEACTLVLLSTNQF